MKSIVTTIRENVPEHCNEGCVIRQIIIQTCTTPIFHQKPCLRWLPNANEIDTNNMKSM